MYFVREHLSDQRSEMRKRSLESWGEDSILCISNRESTFMFGAKNGVQFKKYYSKRKNVNFECVR